METHDLLLDLLDRVHSVVQRTLNGLTLDELHRQPSEETNSIAWLVWHLTRVQDVSLAGISDREQLWISQAWHKQFGLPNDPKFDGFGHTPDDLAAFRIPSTQLLLDYHLAVLTQSKLELSALTPVGLDRELDEPQYQPLPRVGVRLVSVLSDNLQHAGQAAYVRGLFQGKGWQTF